MSNLVLKADNITKSYGRGAARLDVLRGVNLQLHAGDMAALIGPSGSGKSTLLQILGLLDDADGGILTIGAETVFKKSNHQPACAGMTDLPHHDDQRTALRRRAIGFVYQFHHLLPEFTALENVNIPQMIAGKGKAEAAARSRMLLESVGLAPRLSHRPAELSGGEQQRVAIARALAGSPQLIIADEPTGNLDAANSVIIFNVLRDICAREGVAVLMATHNLDLARQLGHVMEMKDGIVIGP